MNKEVHKQNAKLGVICSFHFDPDAWQFSMMLKSNNARKWDSLHVIFPSHFAFLDK